MPSAVGTALFPRACGIAAGSVPTIAREISRLRTVTEVIAALGGRAGLFIGVNSGRLLPGFSHGKPRLKFAAKRYSIHVAKRRVPPPGLRTLVLQHQWPPGLAIPAGGEGNASMCETCGLSRAAHL